MASGDTKTEALLNILGNGGSYEGISGSGNTKTQDYIIDAINRVQGLEDDVEEIKNNPDVVDIVDTYADLQAYDTQHLSNNDIIRVLADETHSGNSTYYRFTKNPDTWTFIGEISGGGGGGSAITELTSANYDYPTNNPNGIALWKLDVGFYKLPQGTYFYLNTTDTSEYVSDSPTLVMINNTNPGGYMEGIVYNWKTTASQTPTAAGKLFITGPNGSKIAVSFLLTDASIYADNEGRYKIRLGNGATSSGTESIAIGKDSISRNNYTVAIGERANAGADCSIAIGYGTTAGYKNSIAIGRNANISRVGEMNIGSGPYNNGYNNTPYRVLGGVYDGQDAHDAVTVEQVNATIDAINTALSTSIPHIGTSS